MGWAAGSDLARELWQEIRPSVAPSAREKVAQMIYDKFTDYDADDWDGHSLLEEDAGVNQDEE